MNTTSRYNKPKRLFVYATDDNKHYIVVSTVPFRAIGGERLWVYGRCAVEGRRGEVGTIEFCPASKATHTVVPWMDLSDNVKRFAIEVDAAARR